jgi:hypothetical protein
MLERYQVTTWRRDREESEMPAGYAGTLRGRLWAIFNSWPSRQVLSVRQIRKILASNPDY